MSTQDYIPNTIKTMISNVNNLSMTVDSNDYLLTLEPQINLLCETLEGSREHYCSKLCQLSISLYSILTCGNFEMFTIVGLPMLDNLKNNFDDYLLY